MAAADEERKRGDDDNDNSMRKDHGRTGDAFGSSLLTKLRSAQRSQIVASRQDPATKAPGSFLGLARR